MNRSSHRSAVFKVVITIVVIGITLVNPPSAYLMGASSDQFSHDLKGVGTLQYGETSGNVLFQRPPKYRAFKFFGKKGDLIEVWVRSPDGDPFAYVVDSAFKVLGKNDDADNSTNAHINLTLPGNSNPDMTIYYIVVTEYYGANATFRVSLKCPEGPGVAKWPSLNGRWIDDLNSQTVDIAVTRSTGGVGNQDKIVGKYATSGKSCRNPDRQGHPWRCNRRDLLVQHYRV